MARVRSGRPAVRLGRAALALVATAALATSCTAARNALGTSNGACFMALPTANSAVGGHGHLVGVRLVNVSELRKVSPPLYLAAVEAPGPRVTRVCLVAFGGRFRSDRVLLPVGVTRGHLAVVETVYPGHQLLATLIIARSPLPFGHSHLGIL